MTDASMVCPECGHDTFEQTRTTRTEYTLTFGSASGWFETSETCVDGGDMDDGAIQCAECRAEVTEDELVTVEQYSEDDSA